MGSNGYTAPLRPVLKQNYSIKYIYYIIIIIIILYYIINKYYRFADKSPVDFLFSNPLPKTASISAAVAVYPFEPALLFLCADLLRGEAATRRSFQNKRLDAAQLSKQAQFSNFTVLKIFVVTFMRRRGA